MSAKKITDFTTPTGVSGNILSPSSWISVILGTVVLIVGFAVGQNVANAIGRKLPMVDTTIDPIVQQRAPVQAVQTRETY